MAEQENTEMNSSNNAYDDSAFISTFTEVGTLNSDGNLTPINFLKKLGSYIDNTTLTEPAELLKENVTDSSVQQTTTSLSQTPSVDVPNYFCSSNRAHEAVTLSSSSTSNNERAKTTSTNSEDRKRLWQRTEKFDDPEAEKKRNNAIKSRNNRQKNKEEKEQLNKQLSDATIQIIDLIEERDQLIKTVEEERKKHTVELLKEREDNAVLKKNLTELMVYVLQDNPNLISNNLALMTGFDNGPMLVPVVQHPSTTTGALSVQLDQNIVPVYPAIDDGAVQSTI